jgi:hypothetical protein
MSFDLDFEREAQERAYEYDPGEDGQAAQGRLDRDRIYDIGGDEEFEAEQDRATEAGPEIGDSAGAVGLSQQAQERQQGREGTHNDNAGPHDLDATGDPVDAAQQLLLVHAAIASQSPIGASACETGCRTSGSPGVARSTVATRAKGRNVAHKTPDSPHEQPPERIILDLYATEDPIHGDQEGRFFHGYYDRYCYLPLYIFCGRHLLVAKLRRSYIDGAAGAREEVARIVGQIRRAWPQVRIVLRADSGFCREELMSWCEANRVDYLFGLARNKRLAAEIETELAAAAQESRETGRPARRFKDCMWQTRSSWGRRRRVVG